MRKISTMISLMIALLLLLSSVVLADTSLDDEVPFGLTCSKNGQLIPVFEKINSKTKTDLLQPDQLCALDYSTLQGKNYWYHIVYLDETGEARSGYIKENNFDQLTLSAYTELLSDPKKKDQADLLLSLAETSPLFTGNREETGTKQAYVLNTNTKKFHYPDCRSVKQMKKKNRKDYTGTREEVINMGYVPCKNCNP